MVINLNELELIARRLQENPDLLAGIIGSAMDAIIAVDDTQRIVLFNAAAERIFACPANQAIGSSIERFIPQRFRCEYSSYFHRFAESSGITNCTLGSLGTLCGLRATGDEFPIEASVSKIESGDKKFFAAVIRDITERQRADEALRKSEERFRLAARSGKMFVYEWDVATDVVVRSGDITSVLGSTGEVSLKRQQLLAKIHPDDRALFDASVSERTPEHPDVQISYRLLHPDGSVMWVEKTAHAFFDEPGRMVRMIGMVADISERKQAEDKLREYQRAVEASGEMITVIDREYRCLMANREYLKFRNLNSDQVLGHFAYELVDRRIFEDVIKPKLDECFQGKVVKYELKYTYPELGERILFISYFPIEGPNCVNRVTCLIQDITARKKAEQALAEMTRKLIEAQEQERARIGRELHDDINQRLAMLSVELERLGDSRSEVHSRVQELRKELCQISDDVQAISHDLHSSKLEYLGAIAGMKSWCKEFAERQKMEIQFRSDVARVLPLDVGLSLFRVLQEALHNASKHSGVKQVEVQLQEHSGEIHLIVRDLGRGFDVETALRGKGLGLTSMSERIRLVNGTVGIESRPMGGTNIHVRVPLERRSNANRLSV
jgi:PAS domain S-box-containing protein